MTGLPFAAPSANPSGEESPKDAQKVLTYFDGKIEGVVDGGTCGIGRESTLISLASKPFRILRQGALNEDAIADALVEAMTLVGITGPSGSGKTTALKTLENLGALVIDCDALYHELLRENTALVSELAARFPDAYANGRIDRRKLASQVFSDSAALSDLNIISHRFVRTEVTKRLREWALEGGTLAAVDAIELFDGGLAASCDLVVGVLAGREERISRIMRRDGLDYERAAARIDAQKGDSYFEEKCDYILYNNGNEKQFSDTCREYFTEVVNCHG